MQELMLGITTLLVLLLACAFVWVIRASTAAIPAAAFQRQTSRLRSGFLSGLLVLGTVISVATLVPWPHSPSAAGSAPLVVTLTGSQWSWEAKPSEVPVGRQIEFAATSTDVNHGVGIYDPDGRMVTQVQAMPGYVNRLYFTFRRPGTYRLLCLEYCGLAHHDMIDEIRVTAN